MGLSAQNTIKMKREVRQIHWYTAEKEKTNDTKVINNTISLGFQRQSHNSLEYCCFSNTFDIRMSDLLTIQFRLSFKDKGHKSLEYYCLVIHLASVISTISYPESNSDIFIIIAP